MYEIRILSILERRSKLFWWVLVFALVAILGIIDYLTGYELTFSLFYLAPISLAAWFIDRRFGLVISFVSALVWVTADITSGHVYSTPAFYVWDAVIRFCFFVIVTLLLSSLRKTLRDEQRMARTDYVTGAVNVRYFNDLAQMELNRLRRYQHPFTMVYIDLDNFKVVNDRYGHSIGDKVLKTIVMNLQENLRGSDIVARLGGDEFALLFPETGSQASHLTISRIKSNLRKEMQRYNWPVTFSIGVVTFISAPATVDEAVKITDDTMYLVKTSGKDGVSYAVYSGPDANHE